MPYRLEPGEWPPVKTQTVRIYDVLLLGPAMVAAGLAIRDEHPVLGWFVAINGALTSAYNGYNYLTVQKRRRRYHLRRR